MRCPHCGFDNETTARFCANPGCGRYLDRPAAPAAAPAAPAAPTGTSPAGPVPTATPPPAPAGAAPVAPPVSPMAPAPAEPQAPGPPSASPGGSPTAPGAPPGPAAPSAPGTPGSGDHASGAPAAGPPGYGPPGGPAPPQRAAEARPGRGPVSYTFTRARADPVQVNPVDAPPGADALTPSAGSRSPDGRQGLYVVLEEGTASVLAGSEHVARVKVSNTGSLVERVDLRAEGLPHDWVTFEPPQVNLDQNAEQIVLMRVRPPRSAGTAAGQRPYYVQVWSLTNPAVNVAVRGAIDVAPFAECTITVDPMMGTTKKQARFTAHITNGGNLPLSAVLEAGDQNGQVRVHPPRVDLTVPPGRPIPVELQVTARKRIWFGSQELHRVGVAVGTADAPLASATASMTQVPTLPRWTARALPFVVIGLAALMVLGYQQWARVKPRPVPSVLNKPVAEATKSLESAGFKVETKSVASDKAKDVVVAQNPEPTKQGLPGSPGLSTVTLSVSAGAAQVAVPDLRNQTVDEAKAIAGDNFTVAQVAEEPSDDVEAGRVTKQEPAAGEKAGKGSQIKLTVSSGRKRGTMPGVQGQTLASARNSLSSLGVTVKPTPADLAEDDNAIVVGQDPAAGQLVAPGQTVTLTLAPPRTTTTQAAPPTTAAP